MLPGMLLLLTLACRPFAEGDLIGLEVSQDGPVTWVAWESPEAGPSWVEYGLGGLALSTPQDEGGTQHRVALLGLIPSETYSFQAHTQGSDGLLSSHPDEVDTPHLPWGLLPWIASGNDYESEGWFLTSVLQEGSSWAVIMNRDGEIVWYREAHGGASIPTNSISRDGSAIYYTVNDREQVDDVSESVRVRLDLTEIIVTRTPLGHHGFAELPDGRHGWLALEIRDVEVEGGEMLTLIGDRILEADEGNQDTGNSETVFSFFDDYAQPFRTCDHFDENGYNLAAQDWTHTNSMLYSSQDDAYYLGSKNLDAVVKVDRASGEVLWQVGGRDSDVAFDEADLWSHGHLSQVWDGGMVIFDNGAHHDPQISSIREYAWDLEAGTMELVFDYPDPRGRYVKLLGDARKLPSGNYLGAWTSAGLITEVDPNGELLWQLESPLGSAVARITYLEDLYDLQ